MSLISKQDFINASGLHKFGILKQPISSVIMHFAGVNAVNNLYNKLRDKKGTDFFESFIRERKLKYVVFEEDLAKIPKTGPFILVANHPLGAIDGILMTKIVSELRPDFKIMGNFLLSKIEPMSPYVISVNPFESRKELHNSATGMRETLKHLENGGCVGIFPAGEVSNKNNKFGEIMDRNWERTAIKLIKKAQVPVVPMYFHAKNSAKFYRLAKIHPNLQTLLLPSEMMHSREKPIRLRIGRPISLKAIADQEDLEELGEFLKRKVYMMKSYYERRKSLPDILKLPNLSLKFPLLKDANIIQNIIEETPQEDLKKEIEYLKAHDKLFFCNGNYEVYFCSYQEIPSIMREIGRQRELTFRQIGEGSNLPYDLDEYDQHYYHLFLWDSEAGKLVGAYRMGLGKEIMKKHGVAGFYTSSLFEFDQELHPFFRKVIEMGRAYILPEYQMKPLPLFLLWRGIVHVCLRNPDHKFLMGGVSISDKFSDFSKSLIIEFMRSHYYDSAVAQYIHPKHEFKIKLRDRDKHIFLDDLQADLNKLDKIIDDLEPELRLPVLIKKYIKQNAKVVAFNVDPNFNDAIDGLMYIRISDLPESTIKPVLEELSEEIRKEQENNKVENQEVQ
ncbi:lysophospholipid acyltransferase family protein [Chryseobacterium sp. MFBS3-17]|uniref:lysophospholipid acyltransferase family protein n=1 Tax=Chryseobacterium sp. MFBS3-17 TaxID=2886689 RepID=UPI001D0F09CD|nr:GNAT family N-acyltransferase [Chryseobacterium sp. MFBS3-17]MCC2590209.1 lysophospholipid acyltransferase family protein [Chryseobacterium sp. MFBS3-17]